MNEKVDITQLTLGMFIAELDRPWIDTPFQLQGFIIESQEQIERLQQLCKFVYIDRQRSLGAAYRSPEAGVTERQRRGPLQSQGANTLGPAKEPLNTGLLASLKAIWHAAFGSSPLTRESARMGSGDQRAISGAPASGISIDYVRPDGREHRGITDAEMRHLVGAPLNRGSGLFTEAGFYFLARLTSFFSLRTRINSSVAVPEADSSDPRNEPAVYSDQTTFEKELPKAAEAQKRSEDAISAIIQDIRDNKPPSLETAEDAVAWMMESIIRNPDSLSWLVRLKSHDHHTYDHSLNVSVYLLNFGRHLGLPKIVLQLLGTAGLLQDLGKVKVPPELLEKRIALTVPECEMLKAHVNDSVEILQGSRNVSPTLLEIVAQHHERYDGSGYPRGLKGDQISMLGAMAGIVDTFVGMTSNRPYGDPISPTAALQMLYQWRGQLFGAEIVQEFIKCVGIFPVGSLVELNTGDAAIVVAHNRTHRRFPRIMLIMDSMKRPYVKPIMLDLSLVPATPGGDPYRIVRSLSSDADGVDLSVVPFTEGLLTSS